MQFDYTACGVACPIINSFNALRATELFQKIEGSYPEYAVVKSIKINKKFIVHLRSVRVPSGYSVKVFLFNLLKEWSNFMKSKVFHLKVVVTTK